MKHEQKVKRELDAQIRKLEEVKSTMKTISGSQKVQAELDTVTEDRKKVKAALDRVQDKLQECNNELQKAKQAQPKRRDEPGKVSTLEARRTSILGEKRRLLASAETLIMEPKKRGRSTPEPPAEQPTEVRRSSRSARTSQASDAEDDDGYVPMPGMRTSQASDDEDDDDYVPLPGMSMRRRHVIEEMQDGNHRYKE